MPRPRYKPKTVKVKAHKRSKPVRTGGRRRSGLRSMLRR